MRQTPCCSCCRRLARGPQGHVGCGLGQVPSQGEVALIVPTVDVASTGETHTIVGVQIEFQMAPGTEAPAEMHFYFPQFRALFVIVKPLPDSLTIVDLSWRKTFPSNLAVALVTKAAQPSTERISSTSDWLIGAPEENQRRAA